MNLPVKIVQLFSAVWCPRYCILVLLSHEAFWVQRQVVFSLCHSNSDICHTSNWTVAQETKKQQWVGHDQQTGSSPVSAAWNWKGNVHIAGLAMVIFVLVDFMARHIFTPFSEVSSLERNYFSSISSWIELPAVAFEPVISVETSLSKRVILLIEGTIVVSRLFASLRNSFGGLTHMTHF